MKPARRLLTLLRRAWWWATTLAIAAPLWIFAACDPSRRLGRSLPCGSTTAATSVINTDELEGSSLSFGTRQLRTQVSSAQVQKLEFDVEVPHVREGGQQTSLMVWPCIEAMNQGVMNVLTTLAPFY